MDATEATHEQQQAVANYRSFVTGQLRSGADSNSVVQRLIQMSLDPAEAARIVHVIQTEITPIPSSSGQALVSTSIPMALLGGLVAAIGGGIVWGLIVKVTDFEIGFMAVGVGLLCGYCVVLSSRGKKGIPYQACAISTSILGIVIGKYATTYFVLQGLLAEKYPQAVGKISFFSGAFLNLGTKMLIDTFHPLDILWIILAVIAANGIARIE